MYNLSGLGSQLEEQRYIRMEHLPIADTECYLKRKDNQISAVIVIDNKTNHYSSPVIYNKIRSRVIENSIFNSSEYTWNILYLLCDTWNKKSMVQSDVILFNLKTGKIKAGHISPELKEAAAIINQLLEGKKEMAERNRARGMEYITPTNHMVVMSYMLVVECIAFYILSKGSVTDLGYSAEKIRQGNLICMITYIFAHSGIYHLVGNMTALLTIGPVLEQKIGALRFLAVYMCSGMFAAYASVLTGSDIAAVTVGASGAICGLLGGCIAYAITTPGFYQSFNLLRMIISLLLVLLTGMIRNLFGGNIDNRCHLYGALGGILVMLIIQLADKESFLKERIKLENH